MKEIWEAGDGCPQTLRAIIHQFEALFKIYRKYKQGEGRETKSHKKIPTDCAPPPPSRRSSRLGGNLHEVSSPSTPSRDTKDPVDNPPPCKVARKSNRIVDTNRYYKDEWMEDHGNKLFDVVSKQRLERICKPKEGEVPECFDSSYYYDQLDPNKKTPLHRAHESNEGILR